MHKPAFTRAEPDARRLSLIEATARVLASHGAAGVSVRTISAEAGVSPGLLGHYFDGIDALVAATYAHVDAQVSDRLRSRDGRRRPRTPRPPARPCHRQLRPAHRRSRPARHLDRLLEPGEEQ